jgi:hypothetical protein
MAVSLLQWCCVALAALCGGAGVFIIGMALEATHLHLAAVPCLLCALGLAYVGGVR